MNNALPRYDVVMLGTFGLWNLGTLQARALPLARGLLSSGLRAAIVTTPWDTPSEAGVIESHFGIPIINTVASSPLNPVPAIRQQVEWAKRLSPALVHVFKPKGFGGFAGRLLQRLYPVIVDSDDWEGDGGWNDKPEYSWVQKRVFHHQELDLVRSGARITAASTLLAERARRLRGELKDETVHLLENGLDDKWIATLANARERPPSSAETPVVVVYSRFAEFEVGWLERFIAELSAEHRVPLTVRVVGARSSLTAGTLAGAHIDVDQMGYVASHRVPAILGSATLGVYPYRDSLIARSKQSVKLLEQMAAGCPVIASDVGDVARTLGDAGSVTRDTGPVAFARLASQMLNRPAQLDTMSAAGIERITNQYSFASLTRRLIAVYRAAGLE